MRGGGRPGFSLPELLVVMVVVSVLAYVAVPAIEIVRFRVDGAARGAMTALVSAQRQAVKRQHDVVVAFDTTRERLRIHQDRDNDGVVGAGEPTRTVELGEGVVFGSGAADWMGSGSGPVTFAERQDGMPAVRFIRNGSASEEGTLYLTSSRSVRTGKHAGDARSIQVARSTGRVTWYRYAPPNWVEAF